MLSASSFLLCYQLWDKPRAVTQPTGRRKGLAARVLAVLGSRYNTEWVLGHLHTHPSTHPSSCSPA